MNKHCYRVIFNKTRQMLMVVSELVSSHTAGQVRDRISAPSLSSARVTLTPLVFGVSLALGLVSLSVQADIVADNNAPGTQQPSVISTANGIPQINIQTPNGDGVSRNQYSQFDVEQRGAILNNSGTNTETKLGGLITANPWLAQGEAKIILNEVNSSNPSQLNGFIEVAGQRADVIIANPAGITCKGCGFINANQTTLAAGKTLLEGGRLKGFEVDKGILTVDGMGLNDDKSDYTRLIGRAVNINAKLYAKDLTVTTGHNRVDAQGNVTKVLSDSQKNKPEFSLDVAAVGGMYANKIKLVGTEQGVGVCNAGQLGAQAGNLTLNSQGKLMNSGVITASADVAIDNQGALENQGDMTAGQDIKLNTGNEIENQGRMLAGRHLAIESAALKSSEKGILIAGVDKDGNRTQSGNLTIQSRGIVINKGTIAASDNLTVENQGDLTNQGRLLAGSNKPGSLKLNSGGHLANSGTIDTTAEIKFENKGNFINQGDITAGQDISINTRDRLDNQGRMLAGRHLDIHSASLASHKNVQLPADRQQQIVLAAGVDKDGNRTQPGNLTLDIKGKLDNQGIVTASDNIDIQNKGTLTNSGDITSGNNITIKTPGNLANQGKVLAGHHLDIQSASLKSTKNSVLSAGTNKTQPGKLTINSHGQLVNQGMMTATDDIVIEEPATLDNQGEISADRDIKITTPGQLTNQGKVLAGHNLDIQSAALESGQKGVLAAGIDKKRPGNLKIQSQGKLDNHGILSASDNIHIQNEGAFSHSGNITSGSDITIRARDHLDNEGKMRAGRNLDIHSAALTNQKGGVLAAGTDDHGNLTQPGNLIINSRGKLVNQGVMTASDDIDIDNQAELENQGEISADHDIKIKTPEKLTNQGKVLAGHNLDIQSADLENQKESKLTAGIDKKHPGNLKIQSQGKLDNHGIITASDNIHIQNEGAFSHSGDITSGGDITIKARDHLDNEGKMRAGRNLDIHSAALTNQKGGVLAAGTDDHGNLTQPGNLIINSRGKLVNQGIMTASDDIDIDNQAALENHGEISADHDIKIKTPKKLTNQGKVLAGHNLDVQSADLENQKESKLAAGIDKKHLGTLKIQSQGKLDNHGIITASDHIHIKNAGAFNHSGNITSGGDITIKARDDLDNAGKVLAGRHLDIHSASLINHQNGVLAASTDDHGNLTQPGNLTIDSRGKLTNQGVLMASDDITIDNQAVLNNQGEISSGHDIRLNTPGALFNQGNVLAGRNLDIHSAALTNQKGGVLAAGTDNHGKQTQPGNLTIDSHGQLVNQGVITASDDIDIENQAALENAGEMSTGRDIKLKTPGHLTNQGKVLAGRHLNIQSASLVNKEKSALAAGVDKEGNPSQPGNLTIHSPGELINLGLITASDNMTVQEQSTLDNQGDMTAGQNLSVKIRDNLTNQGEIQAGKHLDITSTSLDNQKNAILAAGINSHGKSAKSGNLVIHSRDQLTNSGVIMASGNVTLPDQGNLINKKDITAGQDITITTRDHLDNQGRILAGRHLESQSTSLYSHQGSTLAAGMDKTLKLTQSGNLTLKSTETAQLHGQNLAHDQLSVNAKDISLESSRTDAGDLSLTSDKQLNLQSAHVKARQHLTLSAPELINNDQGELRAKTLTLRSQKLKNNQGKITQTGQQSLVLDHQDGIENTAGVIESNGQDLTLKAQTIANEKGRLKHTGTGVISIDTNQFQGKAGHLLSDGELKLTGGDYHLVNNETSAQHITAHIQSLDHRLGNMTQRGTDLMTLDVQHELDNGSGTISANGTVKIKAKTLNNNTLSENTLNNDRENNQKGVLENSELNHLSGQIIAAEDGQLQVTVKNRLNNQKGQLAASDGMTVIADEIDNQQGLIKATNGDMTLTTGQLTNTDGKITGQHNLQLTTQAINNERGKISAGTAEIDTHQQQLNNTAGSIATEQSMTLRTGELLNRYGAIHSNQNLTIDTHGQRLDNRDSGQNGGVFSQGNLRLTIADLNNGSGHIEGYNQLNISGNNIANQHGQILGGKDTELRVDELDNDQGLLQSGGKLTLNAKSLINRNSGNHNGIIGKQATVVNTGALDNESGVLTSSDSLSITADNINNRQGLLETQTRFSLKGQRLDNQSGRITSRQGLSIDTQGQELDNTNGVIESQAALDVKSGDLKNQRGKLHGQSATLSAKQLDNRQQGKILSEARLRIDTGELLNTQGQILALGDLKASVNHHLDNTAGLIRSGGDADLSAPEIRNQETQQQDKGIEGKNVIIAADKLRNARGQMFATENATLTLASELDNSQGQLQANRQMTVQGGHLAVTNTDGEIKSGQALAIDADSVMGDGKLRSLGDIRLTLLKDFIHTGEIIANGMLRLNSQGNVINNGLISATALDGDAANLTNETNGKILANHHQWTVKNKLYNTGLLDGDQTYLHAAELTNQGTGRIYGDHIAIEADTLNNLVDAETKAKLEKLFGTKTGNYNEIIAKGKSAVIAARQHLDLGVEELNNQTHSLIYSDGDFAFGGKLDDRHQATGKGKVINNHSAYIEAMGDMRLAADTINNVNDHFETELQLISKTPRQEYGIWGEHFDFDDPSIYRDDGEVMEVCYKGRGCKENFQIYTYTRTIEESRIKETDPAKIIAGKNLRVETDALHNNKSQVVTGGTLDIPTGSLYNEEVPGIQKITDYGQRGATSFWRIKRKGRDDQGRRSSDYAPPPRELAITLKPGTVQSSQGTVTLDGQRPDDYQGTVAQIAQIRSGHIDAGFTAAETKSREVALRPGQRLEVISQPAAVTGQRPTISSSTEETPVIAGGKLTEPGKTLTVGERSTVGEKLTGVGEKNTATDEKITNVGEKFTDVDEKTTHVGEKPLIIRTEIPDYRLPDNSLFKLNLPVENTQSTYITPVPDNLPLIETDPQFTQLKKWLGTDYMQQMLRWDHNNMHKRLGDGFYEQRLIRDQVINLTGKRYLPGHRNDEEQFKALMNAGVRAQQAFNLAPGIALSPEQMAKLTEDMVWLVNTTVTLPDGRQQTVLAPQVYVRIQAGSLDGSGALLSGSKVNIQLSDDLLNQGRIIGQDINVLAENIRNQGGQVQGNNLSLQARTDMVQRGGTIGANQSLTIGAGHNIDIASTTRSGENQTSNNRFSATYVDNVASVYVQGADGKLHLRAGNDIRASAAQLTSQGKNSEIQLDAGRDVQLSTAKTAQSEHLEWSRDNYLTHTESNETGTDINSAGQISLRSGRDVNLRATGVTAGKTLQVDAGRDVAIVVGEQQQTHDEYLKVKGSNSWVSSTTTTTREQYDRTQAVSSTLSGDTVNIQSGKDTTVQGSNVVGTQEVAIHAGQNLNITTAEETNHQLTQKEEKKSGLMGTGGVGFTMGSSKLKQSSDSDATLHKGSTVGSSDGQVTLRAEEQATLHGSDIIAGKNIDIEAKEVAITAAKNSHTELNKTEQKQSGLTLALSGTVGSAINTAVQTVNEAKDTQDSRLQALKGTQAVLSGVQGYQAYQLSEAESAKADAINQAGGDAQKPTDTIGIQLSYGRQSSKSETRTEQTQSQGSNLNAGQDIRIKATGDNAVTDSGNILVKGSSLKAGHDVEMAAKRDITLESAENTQTTRGKNSSKGGSLGVGLTAGQGGYGIKFSASVNAGKGHETGDGVTHTETQVDAGNQVSLKSGQDMTLKGAQVSGDKVTADIGRNLHLQSEQDKDNYDSKQQNVSAGASFTYGSMNGSASINATRDKMHSTFDSVQEQTGIFAGKGGFDVKVGEHTQLDGAVIASTADKDKNRLETGTLGFNDIQNKAEYKTEHQSAGFSTSGSLGGQIGNQLASNMASNMLAGTNKHKSQSSTTHAAVSDGSIVVRDTDKQQQEVSALSRDTDHAANGLSPIFDKEKEQRRLAQAQAISEIGAQVMDIYNTHEAIKATKAATEKLKDPHVLQQRKQEAEAALKKEKRQTINAKTIAERAYKLEYDAALKKQGADIGSSKRQAVTAVIGALQGLAGGDIKSAIASGAAPYLANGVKALTYNGKEHYEDLTTEEKTTNLMAHAILGGVIAEMKGGSATAGAVGAAGGELAASAIASVLYPDKKPGELSPDEKEKVSNLATLAGGLAAGLATDSTAGGVAGAQTAKNAIENNYLSVNELDSFAHQARTCEGESCKQVIKEMVETNIRNQQEMMDFCNSNPSQCAQKYGYLVDQWPVFERTLKNMDRDGTLPVEFRNYLSAVNTLSQAATGKVGELGWTKRFEAMGISPETAQAMAMTLPIVVEGTKGAKSSPSSSKVTANSQGTNWKAGEGQYSQKNQGTVTNVEHPVGKYDGKSVPNVNKGISAAQSDKIAAQAQQNLLNEINGFTSKSQASKNATMVGAYDPVTGKIATGSSNAKITAEALHPDTVKYIEKQLNVKIGEFTSFCKNKAGACAEVSAADQLVRQGVNPSRIKFTDALRPRDVWRKDNIPSDAIIPPCANCAVSWPKGK